MVQQRSRSKRGLAAGGILLLTATILSGCATLSTAIDAMNKGINQGLSNAVVSPKLNFYLFYSMAAIFSASADQGAAYKQGQGTVWTVTASNSGSTDNSTIEQALLKRNADGTAWWRLEVTSSDGSFLYEYLMGPDRSIEKVRYKDPNSGKIEEFIPDKSKEQQPQQNQPPAAAEQGNGSTTAANGDKVTVTKDRRTVTVKAGTFDTEHVVYADETKHEQFASWTSKEVPGGLVKYIDSDTQSNKVMSQGELTKIESGVVTVLNSY